MDPSPTRAYAGRSRHLARRRTKTNRAQAAGEAELSFHSSMVGVTQECIRADATHASAHKSSDCTVTERFVRDECLRPERRWHPQRPQQRIVSPVSIGHAYGIPC